MKFGQYELLEPIASGGMAEVYKGRVVGAEGFEKLVAIKRIQPDLAADERFVSMLLTEARIHSALSHRNIVQIHDLGISEEGEYFIVLEYVEGYDLRAVMESITAEGEIIPEALSLHIAAEIAQGLHFAHEMRGPDGQPLGLIHRDVSPSNVLISFAGEVKLSDFGLAKRRHDRSVVGSLKGNLIYMSPEQARQAPLDRRTDVFSLGALLFELLTGKRLREITDEIKGWGEVAAGVVRSARSARPDLPASFEALLNQALAADPNRRFPNAGAFGAAIRQLLSQMNTPVGPADLQSLLGLVTPPRKPRGELERSKVIRLVPEAGVPARAAPPPSPGAPADRSLDRSLDRSPDRSLDRSSAGAMAREPGASPLERLRSSRAGAPGARPGNLPGGGLPGAFPGALRAASPRPVAPAVSPSGSMSMSGPPLAPASPPDFEDPDNFPPTPPPVLNAGAATQPAGARRPLAGGTAYSGQTLTAGFPAVATSPGDRRRATTGQSTLLGPAPAPPSVLTTNPLARPQRDADAATPPLPGLTVPTAGNPGARNPPAGLSLTRAPAALTTAAWTSPAAAPTSALPATATATPLATPGPTPAPPLPRPGPSVEWSSRPTPLPTSPPPPYSRPREAGVPLAHDSLPSSPTWQPADSGQHFAPLDSSLDARPSRPHMSTSRILVLPVGVWRSVVVGLAALLVVIAFVVHVAVIPLEVLASWKKPAPLYISSEPEGGWAKLDGIRLVDPTPTKIAVTRDRHEHVIEVEYPGFQSARQIVRFDRSVVLSFMITLEKEGENTIAPVSGTDPR